MNPGTENSLLSPQPPPPHLSAAYLCPSQTLPSKQTCSLFRSLGEKELLSNADPQLNQDDWQLAMVGVLQQHLMFGEFQGTQPLL